MVNKKGWMRILEATIAVLIISGVLIMVYSSQPKRIDISSDVSNLQKNILTDISLSDNLRTHVINYNVTGNQKILESYVEGKIPSYLNFSLKVCDLGAVSCNLEDEDLVAAIYNKEVFVEDIIISSNLTEYNPKKVRLFVWRS